MDSVVNSSDDVRQLALKVQDYMRHIRRHLHQYPELSGKEESTSMLIASELEKMGVPYVRTGDFGIVATVEGNRSDRVVALRADIDALPIQEDNAHLEYQSTIPGVMHACGHDGHVAMLLGAARVLTQLRPSLGGTVKLCFQSAEEILEGTKEILSELSGHKVETVFGVHLWAEMESGKISVEPGARMAAGQGVAITVRGIGTHGASPHKGVDPIVAASAVVLNCSAIISREIDPTEPAALTFGTFNGGVARNVIPDAVTITGTLRTTTPATAAHMREAIPRVASSTAAALRATAEVQFLTGVGPVNNDPYCSKIAQDAVAALGLTDDLSTFKTMMVSENFADFLAVYPGVFALIGVRNENVGACYPHHHSSFNIDEDQLWVGAALHAQYALEYLRQDR